MLLYCTLCELLCWFQTLVCVFQAVYIAPLKALVRERIEDWKVRIEQMLGKKYELLIVVFFFLNNEYNI